VTAERTSFWLALLGRWLKFDAVGILGVGVQLAALSLLAGVFGLHYLLATGLAVETAVLHNFLWHEYWTWRDRTRHRPGILRRLFRFNLTTGGVSILGNLGLMRLLVGTLGLHYLPANLLTIAACGLLNFLLSEVFVFSPASWPRLGGLTNALRERHAKPGFSVTSLKEEGR